MKRLLFLSALIVCAFACCPCATRPGVPTTAYPTYTPVSVATLTSTPTVSPVRNYPPPPTPVPTVPVGLTLYMRGTNNAEGYYEFPHPEFPHPVTVGNIYTEGAYVYGDVAVQIEGTVYHQKPGENEPKKLPEPWNLAIIISRNLRDVVTEGEIKGHSIISRESARFRVGRLTCDSGLSDQAYEIQVILQEGGHGGRRWVHVRFFVEDDPLCEAKGGSE
jgi:hypothetical protein